MMIAFPRLFMFAFNRYYHEGKEEEDEEVVLVDRWS